MRFQGQGGVCFFLKSMWAAKLWDCYVIKLLLAGREAKRGGFFSHSLPGCLPPSFSVTFPSWAPISSVFFIFFFFSRERVGGVPVPLIFLGIEWIVEMAVEKWLSFSSRPGLSRSSCERCVEHSVRVWVFLWICCFFFCLCSHLRFSLLFFFWFLLGVFRFVSVCFFCLCFLPIQGSLESALLLKPSLCLSFGFCLQNLNSVHN